MAPYLCFALSIGIGIWLNTIWAPTGDYDTKPREDTLTPR